LANGGTVRQRLLDIDALSYAKSIFQFDTQVTHSAIDLALSEETGLSRAGREFSVLP